MKPFQRLSEEDFVPTHPPDLHGEARAPSSVLVAPGVEALRCWLLDAESLEVVRRWRRDRSGSASGADDESSLSLGLAAPMATIVKLNPQPAAETLVRRLDGLCWVIAWRVDEHRIAVLHVRDRLPLFEQGRPDVARLRELGESGLGVAPADGLAAAAAPAGPAGPAARAGRVRAAPMVSMAPGPETGETGPAPSGAATARPAPPNPFVASSGTPPRSGLLLLALLCLAAAVLFTAAYRQAAALEAESLRLQQQAEATMGARLGEVLAGGDYGEVQEVLDGFASLQYFEAAVVVNARRRAVAAAGDVNGVRMGVPLPPEQVDGARAIALGGGGMPSIGELLTWGQAGTPSSRLASPKAWLIAGAALGAAALLGAAWRLARGRRSGIVAPPQR